MSSVIRGSDNFDSGKLLGKAQTYQNVASSRVLNTNYTNDTNAPILVLATINNSTANQFYIDDIQVANNNSTANRTVYSVIIPVSSTYKIVGGDINQWFELRE